MSAGAIDPTNSERLAAAVAAVDAQQEMAQTVLDGMNEWVAQHLGASEQDRLRIKNTIARKANQLVKGQTENANTVVTALGAAAQQVLQEQTAALSPVMGAVSPQNASLSTAQMSLPVPPGSPVPPLQTDGIPSGVAQLPAECPPDEVLYGQPTGPTTPVPFGFCWAMVGTTPDGGQLWSCTACGGGVVGGGGIGSLGGGGSISVGGPITPVPTGGSPGCSTGMVYADGTCFTGDQACLLSWGGGDPNTPDNNYGPGTDQFAPYFLIYTNVLGQMTPAGWYSPSAAAAGCGAGAPPPPPPPEPEPATPCELPPDVDNWPGQRVVILPYDLTRSGEKSTQSECGKLLLADALSTIDPIGPYLDVLSQDDPWQAMFDSTTIEVE